MSFQPGWIISMWGPGVTCVFVQIVWFWAAVGVKVFVWFLFFVALWLTLWARQLRKSDGHAYLICRRLLQFLVVFQKITIPYPP